MVPRTCKNIRSRWNSAQKSAWPFAQQVTAAAGLTLALCTSVQAQSPAQSQALVQTRDTALASSVGVASPMVVAQVFDSEEYWLRQDRDTATTWNADDDDEDRPAQSGTRAKIVTVRTYKTLCVRLCDGFYWPVSYATTADRFSRDAQACASSCAVPAKLYVQPHDGGAESAAAPATASMTDLAGRPYSKLKVADMFRTVYNPSCACKPQPWDKAALARHHRYAVAAGLAKPESAPVAVAGKVASSPLKHASRWVRTRLAFPQSRAVASRVGVVAKSRVQMALVEDFDPKAVVARVASAKPVEPLESGALPKITYLATRPTGLTPTGPAPAAGGDPALAPAPPMGLGVIPVPGVRVSRSAAAKDAARVRVLRPQRHRSAFQSVSDQL